MSVPQPRPGGSDQMATAILAQAAEAQGATHLKSHRNVIVRFEGRWHWPVTRVQPVLIDEKFRGNSQEWYRVNEAIVYQRHDGAGGMKTVYRDQRSVHVSYNKMPPETDPEVLDAAALVADNYRMFVMGAFFFLERAAPVQYLGCETIGGQVCDNLLADLKPGLGNSAADRVVISIDRNHHWIRRVRITVDGMQSTRGAIADIEILRHIEIGGIVWPTEFHEQLREPFDAPVHDFRIVAIDYDGQEPAYIK